MKHNRRLFHHTPVDVGPRQDMDQAGLDNVERGLQTRVQLVTIYIEHVWMVLTSNTVSKSV